jgi:hypothetical protein
VVMSGDWSVLLPVGGDARDWSVVCRDWSVQRWALAALEDLVAAILGALSEIVATSRGIRSTGRSSTVMSGDWSEYWLRSMISGDWSVQRWVFEWQDYTDSRHSPC